ncbi:MAG TPA: hypothetical protein V6D47_01790 [Oscillatoriaceae cyanobacterium]
MGPVVHSLEASYANRVQFQVYELDQLRPGTGDFRAAEALGQAAGVNVTPTFLVVDGHGEPRAKYEGITSYATLVGELNKALASR